ncbi:MAG: DUF6673 family protein [Lachnospiraceae bacterium]
MRKIKVEIIGKQVEADLLNPDVAEQFDKEYVACIAKIKGAVKAPTGANGLRVQCMAIMDFIENIFGDGSAKEVFGGETDLLTCLDALEDMTDLYEKQVNPLIQERSTVINKKLEPLLTKAK